MGARSDASSWHQMLVRPHLSMMMVSCSFSGKKQIIHAYGEDINQKTQRIAHQIKRLYIMKSNGRTQTTNVNVIRLWLEPCTELTYTPSINAISEERFPIVWFCFSAFFQCVVQMPLKRFNR